MVIAHHLILTGYGHWLPNDPRGSTSRDVVAGKLRGLGKLHIGRKFPQPPRKALKSFYREAQSQLEHPALWFDAAKRQVIVEAFTQTMQDHRYTCFACAILSNHAHLIIRKHRDRAETMIDHLRTESSAWLCRLADAANHKTPQHDIRPLDSQFSLFSFLFSLFSSFIVGQMACVVCLTMSASK